MKKLLLLFGLASSLVAQQRNTVYLQLAANQTTIGGPYLVTNNIGQSFHTFVVIYGGGTSCSTQNFTTIFSASIETSYDGVLYTPTPQTRVSFSNDVTTNTSAKLYRASGAYPFIRLRETTFPSVLAGNCKVNIYYTGVLNAPPIGDATNYNSYTAGIVSTTACTPLVQFTSQVSSNFKIGLLGFIGSNLAGSPLEISLYNGSTCTDITGITTFVIPANGSFTFPVDPLNSPLSIAPYVPVDSTGTIGIYYKALTSSPNAIIYVATDYIN